MTIRERLIAKLIGDGLWPAEAEAVMTATVADYASQVADPTAQLWSDQAEGYPSQLFAVLYLRAVDNALQWIDENKPMHFARAIFEAYHTPAE